VLSSSYHTGRVNSPSIAIRGCVGVTQRQMAYNLIEKFVADYLRVVHFGSAYYQVEHEDEIHEFKVNFTSSDNIMIRKLTVNDPKEIGKPRKHLKGISFEQKLRKWRIEIRLNGKVKFIGYRDEYHEAVLALKEAKEKYTNKEIKEDIN